MATSTTNLGLTKPAYSDDADIADINDNMDILDAKIGAVGNTSVQNQINSASASISANAQNIGKLKDDVAITEDGDTATHSISTGQYVIWKGNMYKATQNIAVSSTLSSSNLDPISSGVSNDLGYKLSTHNHDDRYYTESEIDTQIGALNQALQTHNHDDRYYTESEIDTQVAGLNARIDALDPEQGVGIFTDVAFSIPLSSWTASNNVWTYTYVNPVITARSGIDVIYDSSYRTAMKGDVDIVKNTGNIVFTTNRQPVGPLSGTVRVFDSVQGVLTTDKGGTGGITAQAARENLGIYANNIQMSSSDNTSVSTAIDTNSQAIAKKANIEQKNVSDLNTLQTAGQLGVPLMSTWDINVLNNPSSALGDSGDGVCLGVGWGNYGSQIAVGRANGTPVTRTYSNGTWYGWERLARMPKYTAVASGQYTTASWAYGTNTCTWTASETGLYLVWMKYELADTSAANRNAYKQLQMTGTATRLLDSTLYYDAGISDGSAFVSRTISQPVYVSSAGQTITPYVHTGTAGIVFDVKIIGVKIAE